MHFVNSISYHLHSVIFSGQWQFGLRPNLLKIWHSASKWKYLHKIWPIRSRRPFRTLLPLSLSLGTPLLPILQPSTLKPSNCYLDQLPTKSNYVAHLCTHRATAIHPRPWKQVRPHTGVGSHPPPPSNNVWSRVQSIGPPNVMWRHTLLTVKLGATRYRLPCL